MKPKTPRYGIVASRFNRQITEGLLQGAVSFLKKKSIPLKQIDIRWVPGAFELPFAAYQMAHSHRYQFIVAVGCILEGETPQYRYLAQAVFQGLGVAGVLGGVPITCGVVVARSFKQALSRSRAGGAMNRGREAAGAAWEVIKTVNK